MIERLDGLSKDLVAENIEIIGALFPSVVKEGKIDFEQLELLLGKNIVRDKEQYDFCWHGKSEGTRLAQKRSTGTLRPCLDESKFWKETGNIYIEGDNLEVLKLLQASYNRRVKMIYIDPPYNTGHDFIYKDNFEDNIASYKAITGQAQKSNAVTDGRYHTNWLNMIYPRLKLARNLLTDDGVIFISIDDNELANLKKVCDEVLGENNFIAQFPRITKKGGKSTETFAKNNDYILAYCKNRDFSDIRGVQHFDEGFKNKDEYYQTRGLYKLNQTLDYNTLQYNRAMDFPIEIDGKVYVPGGDVELQRQRHNGNHGKHDWVWRWSKKLFEFGLKNGWIEIGKSGRIYTKTYLNATIAKDDNDEYYIKYFDRTRAITTLDFVDNVYSNDNSNKELTELMGSALFDYVKPTSLIKTLARCCTENDDIILDFFAGSSTTADAVMQLNAEDGGKRKFICVQLPERCEDGTEAKKQGYKNICQIGRERIRRAGEALRQRNKDLDVGFKVFKLDSSNLKKWDNSLVAEEAKVRENIQLSIDYLENDRSELDIVYEIMLKYGLDLTAPVERVANGLGYLVGAEQGGILICSKTGLTIKDIESLTHESAQTFIFADRCFNDDNLLINTEEILKTLDKKMKVF